MSNGGYLVRWQLENHPELYDGGVDWEGTLWRTERPEPADLPAARAAPLPARTRAGDRAEQAHAAMVAAGFPAGSEFLWHFHYQYYWDLTQRIYREELDPRFDGADRGRDSVLRAGHPGLRRRLRLRRPADGGQRRPSRRSR